MNGSRRRWRDRHEHRGSGAVNSQHPDVTREHDRPLGPDGTFVERRQQQRRQEASELMGSRPADDRRLSPGRRLDDWMRK
jgi:hypothetical protein